MYNSFSGGLLYEHGIFLHIKANCQVLAVLVAAFNSPLGITLQVKAFMCGNAAQEACKYKSQNRWVSHFDTAEECYLGPPLHYRTCECKCAPQRRWGFIYVSFLAA